jgi:hypothetical protein
MTDHVTPGSLVKIVQLRDRTFAVATYDREGPLLHMKYRAGSASYGEALLQAQVFEARGYELRDETKKEARR